MSIRKAASPGLLERLTNGPVICAEGYLFELERRGYIQAGAFVHEVVLEYPEKVAELHREFAHAGSDVVDAGADFIIGETFCWTDEALGRQPPASRYSPDMSKHAYQGTDENIPSYYKSLGEMYE
jgi:hypothetical protein